jgi:predicted Fe-Mo cluster-binding NifX family protein
LKVAVLGVVENMSGLVCPECGTQIDLFKSGGGKRMAREAGVPFLGAIPIDPKIVEATDAGTPYAEKFDDTPTARALERVIAPILALDKGEEKPQASMQGTGGNAPPSATEEPTLKIAVPLSGDRLSAKLGEAETFAMIEADRETNEIYGSERIPAPDQPPGLLPQWLEGRGVDVVIAGRMGERARTMLEERGIEVRITAADEPAERLVTMYLEDALPE